MKMMAIAIAFVVHGSVYATQVQDEKPAATQADESKKQAELKVTQAATQQNGQSNQSSTLAWFGLKASCALYGPGAVALGDLRAGTLRHGDTDGSEGRTIERAIVDFASQDDYRNAAELIEKAQVKKIKITEAARSSALDLYDKSTKSIIGQGIKDLTEMVILLTTLKKAQAALDASVKVDEEAIMNDFLAAVKAGAKKKQD